MNLKSDNQKELLRRKSFLERRDILQRKRKKANFNNLPCFGKLKFQTMLSENLSIWSIQIR